MSADAATTACINDSTSLVSSAFQFRKVVTSYPLSADLKAVGIKLDARDAKV